MDSAAGVLGVGRMGLPIARRLLAAGYELVAFDPRGTHGLPAAGSAAELIGSVDILVTVLPGAAQVAALDLSTLPDGTLWLDLTSGDPRLANRFPASVAAPMGGGVDAAEAGELLFFVGGSDGAVQRARPLLEHLGTIDHIGPNPGDGHSAKLIANLLWFGQAVAVTEALLLGQSLGIPPAKLRKTLAMSAAGSVFIEEYLDRLLGGDYLESFGLDRCVEELETLASLAAGEGVPFELSNTVARLHREALERFGAVDGELLAAKLLEERAGRALRA